MQITVQGTMTGSLDKELMSILASEIAPAVKRALEDTGNDSLFVLKKHIEEDVYAAYDPPIKYVRRSENAGLGTPLNDIEHTGHISADIDPFLNGRVDIDYEPTGEHRNQKWSDLDGDDLISRIEKKSPKYRWGQRLVPKRPFWKNFTNQMTDGGDFAKSFDIYMQWDLPKDVDFIADSIVEREDADGDY